MRCEEIRKAKMSILALRISSHLIRKQLFMLQLTAGRTAATPWSCRSAHSRGARTLTLVCRSRPSSPRCNTIRSLLQPEVHCLVIHSLSRRRALICTCRLCAAFTRQAPLPAPPTTSSSGLHMASHGTRCSKSESRYPQQPSFAPPRIVAHNKSKGTRPRSTLSRWCWVPCLVSSLSSRSYLNMRAKYMMMWCSSPMIPRAEHVVVHPIDPTQRSALHCSGHTRRT